MTVAAAAFASELRSESSLRRELGAQQQAIAALKKRVDAAQVDWPAVAARSSLRSTLTTVPGHTLSS